MLKYAAQHGSCNQNLRNICGTIFPPPFCDAYKMSISIYVQVVMLIFKVATHPLIFKVSYNFNRSKVT